MHLENIIDSIKVIGYTDSIGSDSYNLELSLKRAETVSEYLITKGIISKSRIDFYGKGNKCPIAPNSTEKGRYKNRRVELIIKYKSAANK